MTIWSEEAAIDLLIAVCEQAQKDAKRGNYHARDFLEWMQSEVSRANR